MGKFTRNRVDSPEYAKNPDDNFFATYFRRVALTYMEIETWEAEIAMVDYGQPTILYPCYVSPGIVKSTL